MVQPFGPSASISKINTTAMGVKLASETKLNNEKIASELKLNNEKLCGKVKISNETLHGKIEASSIGELSGEIKALRSDTNASILVLHCDIGNDFRELDKKFHSTNAKLDTEIGNLKTSMHAIQMNDERPRMTDSGFVKNITRDAKVESGSGTKTTAMVVVLGWVCRFSIAREGRASNMTGSTTNDQTRNKKG